MTGPGGSRTPAAMAAPPVPDTFVRRDRVLKDLADSTDVPVVCLQAPGGYGKTTVLAEWAAEDVRPSIWISVREAVADAAWLAQELVQGLADAGLVPERPVLPSAVNPVAWHLGTLRVVERTLLAVDRPFLLIVDGAHLLSGDNWASLLLAVATHLPRGAQLALATRTELPATLWRLLSRGEVTIVGPELLALDAFEAADLMRAFGAPVPDDVLAGMLQDSEGWPVAMYLAGRSLRSGGPARTRHPSMSTVSVLTEYLRAEILTRLELADADFLLRVSVLAELDGPTCDRVAATSGSLSRLRRLAAANRLLAPLDQQAEHFRLHPLLATFLAEELRARSPESWQAAHASASAACEQKRDLDGAVHHARLAGDDARLGALVWRHAARLLATGEFAVLRRWLEGIDDDRLQAQCGLALAAAWVAAHEGDTPRMERLALAAHTAAARSDRAMVLDADLLTAAIGVTGLADVEQRCIDYIVGKPADEPWLTLAFYLLGVTLLLRDRPEQALAALQEGRRLSVAFDMPIMVGHCSAGLTDIALAAGQPDRAVTCTRQLREVCATHVLHHVATAAPIFTTSALVYVLEGRFADAKQEAARALRLTSLISAIAPWFAVLGRLTLAQVYLALGDSARAAVLLGEAQAARGMATESPLLERLCEETSQRVDSLTNEAAGPSTLTTAEVRVLQYLPTHLSFPEIADELFLSRHTVKTQALSAYRKLGAHSRTEVIKKARAAGLLPPD